MLNRQCRAKMATGIHVKWDVYNWMDLVVCVNNTYYKQKAQPNNSSQC